MQSLRLPNPSSTDETSVLGDQDERFPQAHTNSSFVEETNELRDQGVRFPLAHTNPSFVEETSVLGDQAINPPLRTIEPQLHRGGRRGHVTTHIKRGRTLGALCVHLCEVAT